jgi:hypothetical protein
MEPGCGAHFARLVVPYALAVMGEWVASDPSLHVTSCDAQVFRMAVDAHRLQRAERRDEPHERVRRAVCLSTLPATRIGVVGHGTQ